MAEKLLNGVQEQLFLNLIPAQAQATLRISSSTTGYLGSVTYDAVDGAALRVLAEQFHAFVAQQTGGLQVAAPSVLSGLKGNGH